MNEYRIRGLSENQRQWLFKAIIKMVLIDEKIDELEMNDLTYALGLKGIYIRHDVIQKVVHKSPESIQLERLKGIDFEDAFLILSEIAKTAAVDGEFHDSERQFLRRVIGLLNFNEEIWEDLERWMEKLVEVHRMEQNMMKDFAEHHK